MKLVNYFSEYQNMLFDSLKTVDSVSLCMMEQEMRRMYENSIPLLVCGNGGSAAISEHFTCDHNKGICMDTTLNPFIVSLTSNVSLTTAIANDIGYSEVFSKQIEWFQDSRAGLLVISSSGNSPNIVKALEAAKKRNMKTMALLGFDGGVSKTLADISVHIKSNNYGVVEDCHQIIMHTLSQFIRINHSNQKEIRL